MRWKLLSCVLLLCCGGCIVPIPGKVTSGQKYSSDALHFLDLPDTTREDVIASLGPPLIEVPEARVLLYSWEKTSRQLVIAPDALKPEGQKKDSAIDYGESQQWGLFIGYSEQGLVRVHQVQKIGTSGLAEACVKWATSKGISR
jgi:hypothetical protein